VSAKADEETVEAQLLRRTGATRHDFEEIFLVPVFAVAIALALGAVVAASGINWALSGMYLGPIDYLAQVYGLLVPAQLLLAFAGALAGAR